jgi:hypothetical protein
MAEVADASERPFVASWLDLAAERRAQFDRAADLLERPDAHAATSFWPSARAPRQRPAGCGGRSRVRRLPLGRRVGAFQPCCGASR